jgi:hypothetical protein
MSSEIERPARSDIEMIGSGSTPARWSSEADVARTDDARTWATNAMASSSSGLPSMDGGRHAGFDQFDPSTVDDLVMRKP